MAIVYTFRTSATLAGARNLNRAGRIFAQEDVGFKIERLISQVNLVITAVSALNAAISAGVAASNASGFSFTAISATTVLSNFRA
jgi:hypothetical protein